MPRRSTTPVDPSISAGEIVDGKYRVDAVIGRGGMGIVVAATHVELGQRVALKFLHDTLSGGEAVERFKREAQAAARLKSDHSVRVFDVGRLPGGAPYMVMELLEGTDLDGLLEQRGAALPIDEAVDYVVQACAALAEAHAAGIIHRDLKPQNLFLARKANGERQLKVLDFGISKMKPRDGDHALTATNAVMGSPSYMSPEQIRSTRDADERTDVWALGVILYLLLSGQLPFVGETVTQLTAQILEETPPPLRALRPNVPDALDRIVTTCLSKRPEQRFASVAELAASLDPFLPTSSQRGLAPRPSSSAAVTPRGLSSASASARQLTGGTSGAWADTVLAPQARRWRRASVVVGALLVAGATLLVLARYRATGGPVPATGTSSAAEPRVAASVVGVAPAAPLGAPPASAASEHAVVPAGLAASSSAVAAVSSARGPRGHTMAPLRALDAGARDSRPASPASGAGGDLPDLRK